MASDYRGNCYLTGLFPNDTIHFGSHSLVNSTITNAPYSTDEDAFLVKYDRNGNVIWATQTFEKNINPYWGNDAPESVCIDDGSGNVYLSGNFIDTLFIGSNTLITYNSGPQPQSMYLAKYNSNGNILWAKQATCINDSSFINSIHTSCDNSGNIYVTGSFLDTVHIGNIMLFASSQILHSFLAKYDSNGNVSWAEQSTGYGNEPWGVTNDKFGNTFITGNFYDSVTFGAHKLINGNPNNSDFYIVKYTPDGNVLWAKTAITPGANAYTSGAVGWAVTTDLSGNVYVTGQCQDTVIFANDTLISPQYSFFLAKYDSNGNLLWAKNAKVLDNNDWYIEGLSSDNSKHIYLVANGSGEGKGTAEIVFAGDTLTINDTAKYGGPSVIYRLDSNGNVLCSSIISVGGGSNSSVASDTSGNYIYISATVESIAIFGKDTINPFAYPINPIQRLNYFPFVARWEECDSNVIYASVNEVKGESEKVKVYPNPNNGIFNIVIASEVKQSLSTVEIYNVFGEKVYSIPLNLPQEGDFEINLSGQPDGVYLYRVIDENSNLIGEGKMVMER